MLFQSYIFILLFFPLCLLGFWGLKRQKLLQLWLIAFSLWFYGAASPYYLLLLLGSIAWNYAFFRRHRAWLLGVLQSVFPGVLWSAQSMGWNVTAPGKDSC